MEKIVIMHAYINTFIVCLLRVLSGEQYTHQIFLKVLDIICLAIYYHLVIHLVMKKTHLSKF